MSIRYIGSKARLAPEILNIAGEPHQGRFVDLFSGTGTVSREAANRGWAVLANDFLPSAATLTRAQLTTYSEASFNALGGYELVSRKLNEAMPRAGFISREYAPGALNAGRRYFTNENAEKLDGMLHLVRDWDKNGFLTEVERILLLGDLIQTANAVANTAGTYACYLRQFAPNALRPARVTRRVLLHQRKDVEVTVDDALSVVTRPDDVVYLDPPYTKRQYAAYYHILETIVAGDEPKVSGVTGLRPWRDRSSDFCHKARALGTLVSLVGNLRAGRMLFSYSNDGHIALDDLSAAIRPFGKVQVHDLGLIRRYAPNAESRTKDRKVREVLVELTRESPTKQ